jgi:hypothetical protein
MKTVANHNPVVRQVRLGNLSPRDYLIDVGNEGSVLIQQPDRGRLRRALGGSPKEYEIKMEKGGDASNTALASDYFVRIAGEINGLRCPEYELAGLVNDVSHQKFGNMGLSFLKQVFETITLDFPGGRFYYEINTKPEPQQPFDREVYFTQVDTSFLTGPVLKSSSWYEQGLRPGMPVVLINGGSPSRYMIRRKSGQAVTLESVVVRTKDSGNLLIRKK